MIFLFLGFIPSSSASFGVGWVMLCLLAFDLLLVVELNVELLFPFCFSRSSLLVFLEGLPMPLFIEGSCRLGNPISGYCFGSDLGEMLPLYASLYLATKNNSLTEG